MTSSPDSSDAFGNAVLRKVALRLIPFLFLLYVVNLIDRTNIGIAKLQMVDQEPQLFDAKMYGYLAGFFYIGYLLFEVPSNLILMRVGARRWIARIAISWGLVSTLMMFVTGPWGFGVLRFLLGFAEAGFFPGIILYMTYWFPSRIRARAIALFMTGGPIATFVGNFVSGIILTQLDGVADLRGWQWVFLLEGIPSVLLGIATLYYLTERPETATWLTDQERKWLVDEMQREKAAVAQHNRHTLRAAFVEPRVWLLIAIYFTVAVGDNVYGFYVPTFVKSKFAEYSEQTIGMISATPSLVALVAMILVGWHSDSTGERRWHVACSAFVACCGWLVLAADPSPWVFMFGVVLVTAGMKSMLPTFWTLPNAFLTGVAAASGVALINSVANLGGWLGPMAMSQAKGEDGSFLYGYLLMAGTLLSGGLLAFCVRVGVKAKPNNALVEGTN